MKAREKMKTCRLPSLCIAGVFAFFLATSGCGGSSGRDLNFTSSVVNTHNHSFALTETDLAAGTDIARDTSVADGHSHSVTLTTAELATISQGGLVSKDTSNVLAHIHNFQFITTASSPNGGGGGYGY